MKPSPKECKAVSDLLKSEGWQCIRSYIEKKIVDSGKTLLSVDAANVARVAQAQGYIKAYQELLAHVDFITEPRVQEESGD